MPYSEETDLLLGDLLVSPRLDKNKFIQDAADEIDSKLGFIYTIPLAPVAPETEIPAHEVLLLKQINNKLASGRLIMTLDIAGEGTTLHAYGLRLVTEAQQELMLIANGFVELSAVRKTIAVALGESKVPRIVNADTESGVDIFYEHAMRGHPSYWRPGDPLTSNG